MTIVAILAVLIVGCLLFMLSPQFHTWRERRRMDKRDAKLRARGIIPFPRSNR
jgi:uncharacterized integral membrane protein